MKKFYFIAIATLALASCAKNEVATLDEQQITFAPATYSLATKAEGEKDTVGEHSGHVAMPDNFGVYAWFSPTTGTANQAFMVNETVTPAGIPAHTYYWPKDGKIDFVGYYPYGTCWFGVSTNPKTGASYKYTATDVTIIPAEGATKDLMYADEAIGYNKTVVDDLVATDHHFLETGVPMLFHHALSQLTVKVKQSVMEAGEVKDAVNYTDVDEYNTSKGTSLTPAEYDALDAEEKIKTPAVNNKTTWEIKVNNVKIDKIGNVGSVEIPTNTVWTEKTGSAKFTKTWAPTGGQTLTNSAVKYDSFENFLVMPQALATGETAQTVTVNYTITTTRSWDPSNPITETVTSKPIEFKTTTTPAIASWEMGKSYVYTLIFTPTPSTDPTKDIITLDPALVNWVEVDAAPITVDELPA